MNMGAFDGKAAIEAARYVSVGWHGKENHMKSASLSDPLISRKATAPADKIRVLPFIALFSAALLWGGSFSAMRFAVGVMSPWSVMWLRMVIALSVMLPFLGRLQLHRCRKTDWPKLALMVLFQPCLYFFMESHALTFTTSSQAGVISASVPLMVTVGAWLVLAEPVSLRTMAGLFLSVAGVIALSLTGNAVESADRPLLGNMLELGAMASAAANILLVKRLCERYNPWLLTALQIIAGSLFFSPGLVLLIRQPLQAWSLVLVLSIVFLGAFVTLGAFGLYNWAMSQIPAARASIFINLVPVIAVAIGWLVMGESLSSLQCLAAGAVVAGVALSQRR